MLLCALNLNQYEIIIVIIIGSGLLGGITNFYMLFDDYDKYEEFLLKKAKVKFNYILNCSNDFFFQLIFNMYYLIDYFRN